MRASVVICTYNRADGLRNTLDALSQQRYPDFEVVVVNGPSTDDTVDVVTTYPRPVRLLENPLANLSVSRNLGIRHSAGDVVAFIDDDALPEPAWLEQALPHFAEGDVAGVGGIVFDHTGVSLQYGYSASTRFGETETSGIFPFDPLCVPGAALFPYLQGTNALFRRAALAEIGLFDEVFDFYLDETDVCCRLVDAGFMLRQLADAPVHHKYLPSARRNAAQTVVNWHSIVRNHVYFGYRHGLLASTEDQLEDRTRSFIESVLRDAAFHEARGDVATGHVERTRAQCEAAAAEGRRVGVEQGARELTSVELEQVDFVPFLDERRHRGLRVMLVTSQPEPSADPLSSFLDDVAPALCRAGHEVRLFRPGSEHGTVDLEQGVWVHRLPVGIGSAGSHLDGPRDCFVSAVRDELSRIDGWWAPEVAFAPTDDIVTGVAADFPELAIVPLSM